MKALFFLGPGKMELKEIEEPSSENGVIVKVIEAGICGTDIKTFLRGHHMFKPPTILGHECYGVVVKKPSFVKKINIGDYVLVAPYGECGVCDKCRRGYPELCEEKTFLTSGCFAQYIEIPPEHALRGIFKIENPATYMVLAEPLACVLGALRKLPHIKNALIIGGGIMGSLFAVQLRSKGIDVRVVEVSEWRLSFLKKMGFDVSTPDELEGERAFDTVILASTVEEPFRYLNLIQDGGSLMVFGGYPKDKRFLLDPFHIHYREVSIVGSFGYSLQDFAAAIEELKKEEHSYKKLVTHSYRIDDYEKAFETAINRECMKVSLRMWENGKET